MYSWYFGAINIFDDVQYIVNSLKNIVVNIVEH